MTGLYIIESPTSLRSVSCAKYMFLGSDVTIGRVSLAVVGSRIKRTPLLAVYHPHLP